LSPVLSTPVTGKNYANAAARAATINTAVVSAISLPFGLFNLAKENQPVLQEDGSWLWSYSLTVEYFEIAARLTGIIEGNETQWSMEIDVDNPLLPIKDFVWYTGTSTENNSSGSWQFFDIFTPAEHNPTATIDWSVNLLVQKAELDIENVDTRSEYVNDVLKYTATPETVAMAFDDASDEEIWDIAWDVDTGAGSLTVPKYNNGEKACWDTDKQDIDCGE